MNAERTDWQEQGRQPMSRAQQKLLKAAEARNLLDYDPETGALRWKRHMSTRARAGDEAGVIQQGKYRRVGICGRYYMAHRLAWLIVTGEWPIHEIDHRNGAKADNRWSNLRAATTTENKRNTLHRNQSGLVGAAYHSGKGMYRASIRVEGERKFLGWFDTAEAAHSAYVQASKAMHGEFSPC